MSKRKRSKRAGKPRPLRRKRRVAILAFIVIPAIVVLLLFGRGLLVRSARRMAARQLNSGAISAALLWLQRADWLDSRDGRTELMRATCYRHLKRVDRWGKTLRSAERKGAPAGQVRQEFMLCAIQKGKMPQGGESQLHTMIERGAPLNDVAAVFVEGYLSRKEPQKAKMILDAWAADRPGEVHVNYVRAIYLKWWGDLAGAERELEHVLAVQPGHELARTALADLFEEQRLLDRALREYVEFATYCPASETAKLGLASIMRKKGHLDEARALVEPLLWQAEPSADTWAEMAQIEFESGNYDEAQRRFDQTDLNPSKDSTAVSRAITLALRGEITRSERLFGRIDAATARSRRAHDLRARLAVDPNNTGASDELEQLDRSAFDAFVGASVSGEQQGEHDRQDRPPASAEELFAEHCCACHGPNGDGNGRAARHLFPMPRDLRTGKARLVSTLNSVPTLEDVRAVIRHGMPGTSMPAFDKLSENHLRMLADEVLRLNREGVREQFIDTLKNEGEPIDESDVQQVVELCTTPGDAVEVPQIGPADARAIARGKDTYFGLGCDNCHGDDGTGALNTPLFDDKGRPSPPRDLIHDPMKGGQEPESVYLRVFVGMPGTPHPACYNAPEDQLIDLVHYCRSLSQEPKRILTNHQRAADAVSRPYVSAAAGSPADY